MGERGYLVAPAYNESAGISAFASRVAAAIDSLLAEGASITLVIVDDGSQDGTVDAVRTLMGNQWPARFSVELVKLARNFGHQGALLAGMERAMRDADFVVTLDADGEHPPELVPTLVEKWRDGALMVHTVREQVRELPLFKRATSAAYYRILARVSGLNIDPGMADFKLWDGQVLRDVASLLDRCGSSRAFAAWLFPDAPRVHFRPAVIGGRRSRFRMSQMMSLALDGLIRFSDAPLRLSTWVGVLALAFGICLSGFVLWASATDRVVPGWSSTMIAIAILGGLQALAIGVLSEYLLRNWFRSALPRYLVDRRGSGPSRSLRPRA